MNKKALLIVGGIVFVLALCACIAVSGIVLYQMGKKTAGSVLPTVEAPVSILPTQAEPAKAPTLDLPAPTEPAIVSEPTQGSQPLDNNVDDIEVAKNVADVFLMDLVYEDYNKALDLANSELRGASGTTETLRGMVEDKGLKPDMWAWMTTSEKNGYVNLDGAMHFTDKRRGAVSVQLVKESDKWRVGYLDLHTTEGTNDPGGYATWGNDRSNEERAFAISEADWFLSSWKDQDYKNVWLYMSQPMRDSLNNNENNVEEFMLHLGNPPASWAWKPGFDVFEVAAEHPIMVLKGTLNYNDGSSAPVELQMKWAGGYWAVYSVSVSINQ